MYKAAGTALLARAVPAGLFLPTKKIGPFRPKKASTIAKFCWYRRWYGRKKIFFSYIISSYCKNLESQRERERAKVRPNKSNPALTPRFRAEIFCASTRIFAPAFNKPHILDII
jgi:hypothetical protein